MPAKPTRGLSSWARPTWPIPARWPGSAFRRRARAGKSAASSTSATFRATIASRRRTSCSSGSIATTREEEAWAEISVEDKHAGPAETAIVRIDFSTWLQLLPRRLRKIAMFLANGETTTAAAKRFGVSQGRISKSAGNCSWPGIASKATSPPWPSHDT